MAIWTDPLARLKAIGNLETASYLLLVLVAMPLKYLSGEPRPVLVMGSIHGALFVAYGLAMLAAWHAHRWHIRIPFVGMLSAMVPFGPSWFDRWVRRHEVASSAESRTS